MRSRGVSLLLLLASGAQSGTAWSREPTTRFVPLGETADAPRGFVDMCARDTGLCLLGATRAMAASPTIAPNEARDDLTTAALLPSRRRAITVPAIATARETPSMTVADHDLLALIKAINTQVNRQFAQKTDYEVTGFGEYWEPVSASRLRAGDCEDFAIEKRLRLTQAGIAPDRMFYGVAFVRGLGLHTVLIVRLDEGDYVLDSLAPRVRPWGDSHYSWLRFQVPGQPTVWTRAVDGGTDRAPTVIAGL